MLPNEILNLFKTLNENKTYKWNIIDNDSIEININDETILRIEYYFDIYGQKPAYILFFISRFDTSKYQRFSVSQAENGYELVKTCFDNARVSNLNLSFSL